MNDLWYPLCWSAFQISCLALVGLLLSCFTRRAPATAAFLTASTLAICCALTALAFVPLPDWWSGVTPPPDGEARGAVPPEAPVATLSEDEPTPSPVTPVSRVGLALSWPRFPALSSTALSQVQPVSRWPGWIAGLFLAGVGVGLGRLFLGLWALRRMLRRTRPITERSFLDLVDQLRADLGGTRPVGLRECPELTSAATVGWWRPLILVPAEWSQWDEQQRRAVLAHELAHVARHDCLAWLLARITLVLHFYHPLVYWLVNRLQLQQELAADAVGVRCGGGSTVYLRVLARMALRQDDRSWAAPARAFLSSPGTLVKRITMLKARDGVSSRSAPRGVWALGWTLLVVTALGASTLRTPAAKQDARPDPATAPAAQADKGTGAAAADVPPFDLTYLNADADGYMAIRPAALLARPEMKLYRDMVNQSFDAFLVALTGKQGATWDVHIEDLEQVVCSISLSPVQISKPDEPARNSTMFNLATLRTTKDHDWKKTLSIFDPAIEEGEIEGRPAYHLHLDKLPVPTEDIWFCCPDKRTLLCNSKEALRDLLRGKQKTAMPPTLATQWKHVERCTVAVAVKDIRTKVAGRKPEKEDEFPLIPLLQVSTGLVVGANLSDGLRCQMIVQAATETDAANIVTETRRQMKLGQELGRKPADKAPSKEEALVYRVLSEVCNGYEIERDGTMVHWRGGARVNAADVVAAFLGADQALGK
jgi:beta-lactamase regulating signal transducer with metallopeptidase domain